MELVTVEVFTPSALRVHEKGLAPEPREGPKGAVGVPRWTEPTTGPDLTLLSSALRWSFLFHRLEKGTLFNSMPCEEEVEAPEKKVSWALPSHPA